MEIQLAKQENSLDASTIETVLLGGDLSRLEPRQRLELYNRTCESLGLNPLTRPFEYLVLKGKMIFYARKDCTEQLRKIHSISIAIVSREIVEGCYVVTARATMPNGRADESIGAVPIESLKGEDRSNAFMKAETKSKRRVTLSICGLGVLDESEIDSIPGARIVQEPPPLTKPPPTITRDQTNAAMPVDPADEADDERLARWQRILGEAIAACDLNAYQALGHKFKLEPASKELQAKLRETYNAGRARFEKGNSK